MKMTNKKLHKIINEEITAVLKEMPMGPAVTRATSAMAARQAGKSAVRGAGAAAASAVTKMIKQGMRGKFAKYGHIIKNGRKLNRAARWLRFTPQTLAAGLALDFVLGAVIDAMEEDPAVLKAAEQDLTSILVQHAGADESEAMSIVKQAAEQARSGPRTSPDAPMTEPEEGV